MKLVIRSRCLQSTPYFYMRIYFTYSLNKEIEYALSCVDDYEKLRSAGYHVKIPNLKGKLSSDKQVNFQVKKEYNPKFFENTLSGLVARWEKEENEFLKFISGRKLKALGSYVCYLTRYGSGGSYNKPNEIYVRVVTKEDIVEFTETVKHELLHLMLPSLSEREVEDMVTESK